MSNSDIPLLTDVVAEPDAADPAHVRTQQLVSRPAVAPPEAVPQREYEAFAVFEPDRDRTEATAQWHPPADEAEPQTALADDAEIELKLVESSAPSQEHDPNDRLPIADIETVIAELQTTIAADTFELTDRLMRAAFSDLEARVFRQISTNLREQLPELIDSVVRAHLLERHKQPDEGD